MELSSQAENLYTDALGYMKSLESRLEKRSKFSDEVLVGIAVMALQKLYLSILAHYGIVGSYHRFAAMLKDVTSVVEIPEKVQLMTKKVSKFESMCTIEKHGNRAPREDEFVEIINGLLEFRDFTYRSIVRSA